MVGGKEKHFPLSLQPMSETRRPKCVRVENRWLCTGGKLFFFGTIFVAFFFSLRKKLVLAGSEIENRRSVEDYSPSVHEASVRHVL